MFIKLAVIRSSKNPYNDVLGAVGHVYSIVTYISWDTRK